VPQILRPGDQIIAVGGRALTEFTTLDQFSSYVKNSPHTMLQWVLLRRPNYGLNHHHHHRPTVPTPGLPRVVQKSLLLSTTPPPLRTSTPPVVQRQLYPGWTPPLPVAPPPQNPLFRDKATGELLRYQDSGGGGYHNDSVEYDWYDPDGDGGTRAALFVRPIPDFDAWLTQRKRTWKTLHCHRPRPRPDDGGCCSEEEFHEELLQWEDSTVARDFWSPQGFDSVHSWITTRTQKWRTNYSWNQTKRRRLALDCENQTVDMADNFDEWLRVRKNQWLVQRRKRHLHQHREERQQQQRQDHAVIDVPSSSCQKLSPLPAPPPAPSPKIEFQMIDDLIEEEEQREKARLDRGPMDIAFIFDSSKDCPDDIVCKIFANLQPAERLRLLSLNHETRHQLMNRENLWRLMCPTRWKLPRRPRKPYCMIYRHNLRLEMEASRKLWDDLLTKAAQFLLSGDLLGTLEKLVNDAEEKLDFNINYVSGVVCERNSLLNLAVIHQRHRVVRWLVETKGADIESSDRGNFTPLLNAAWAGDRYLIRYLMQRGAKRTTVGRFHYTKGVAPAGFAGHTAEGWATEKGHEACARLLALGL
jgi:Ankyrin repeats (many copies)